MVNKRKSSKPKRKSTRSKKKSNMGRPPISRNQAEKDLIKRCKERGIDIINRRTGKRLSEVTLRHRCTFKNAPLWGGKGDPDIPVVTRKKRRKKRKGTPFKKAPRIIPKTLQRPQRLNIPKNSIDELPEAVTIDSYSPINIPPKKRDVQPTLILRNIPQSGGKFEGTARVVRIPKNASTSQRKRLLRLRQTI